MNTTAASEDALFTEIQHVIEGNGTISPEVKDRLTLKLMIATYQAVRGMNDRLCKVEEQQKQYAPYMGGIKWVFLFLALSVSGLLWALITGQATVTFGP